MSGATMPILDFVKACKAGAMMHLPPGHRMTLLCLADYMHRCNGSCRAECGLVGLAWPSVASICTFTGHGRSTVLAHLSDLRNGGWIKPVPAPPDAPYECESIWYRVSMTGGPIGSPKRHRQPKAKTRRKAPEVPAAGRADATPSEVWTDPVQLSDVGGPDSGPVPVQLSDVPPSRFGTQSAQDVSAQGVPAQKDPPNNYPDPDPEVVVRGTFGGGLTPEERQEAEDLARELPNVTVSATVLSMVKAGRCPSRPQLDVLRAAYASLAGDDRVNADAVACAVDVWAGRRADQPGLSGYTETDADTAAMRRLLVDAYKVSDARGILPGRVLCHWLDSYLSDAALEPSGWPLTSLRFRVGGYGLPDVEAPKTPRAPVPPPPPTRTQEEIDAEAQERRRNAVAGTAAVLAAMKAAGGHPIARPRPAA